MTSTAYDEARAALVLPPLPGELPDLAARAEARAEGYRARGIIARRVRRRREAAAQRLKEDAAEPGKIGRDVLAASWLAAGATPGRTARALRVGATGLHRLIGRFRRRLQGSLPDAAQQDLDSLAYEHESEWFAHALDVWRAYREAT